MRTETSFGSPTLLLVPTELELVRLRDLGGFGPGRALTDICGFGPAAAGARTAQLLARLRPRRVLLVGIAGAYDIERHPVGSALAFGRVAVDGIGAGRGETFQSPPRLGFPQWPGSEDTSEAVGDELALQTPGSGGDLLLTTCAASDSPEHAALRLSRFPEAVAEDMEGFSVGLACALFRTPLAIVRGVSNRVGDRDPANWRIPAALAEARRVALELLERDWAPGEDPR